MSYTKCMEGGIEMLVYKKNILSLLKAAGYTTYKLRQESALSQGCIQSLRTGAPISWANIDKLCALLRCQPGELLEYIPDPE